MLEVRFSQPQTIDPRGRLSVPTRLKSALDFHRITQLVVIVEGDCLRAYTPTDFHTRVEKPLMDNDSFDAWEKEKQLLRLAMVDEMEVDKQGRMTVPEHLRKLVGISRDVMLVSLLDRLEIWDAGAFRAAWEAARSRRDSLGGGPGVA
jgi:MraZ protein